MEIRNCNMLSKCHCMPAAKDFAIVYAKVKVAISF